MTTVKETNSNESSPTSDSSVDRDVPSHHGSLRSKLVLSLAAIFLVFLTIDDIVRQLVIEREFASLERNDAIRDANRVLAAMNAEVEHLCDLAEYYASHPGGFDNPATDDISNNRLQSPQIDWAAFLEPDGTCRWTKRSGRDLPSRGELVSHFRSLADVASRSDRPSLSGMTRIGTDPLVMFAVIDLSKTSDQESGRTGQLVVARSVDESIVTALRRRTQVEFSLQSPRTVDPARKLVIWEADASTLVVEIQLVGVHDENLANVYIEVPRDITARTHRTSTLARNTFVFGSVAALLMLLLLLQRIVIAPLAAIREHSGKVAEEGLTAQPLMLARNDEIGQLASAFDQMFRRLKTTQNQLTKASREAGQSQVASTVIHNVGNVLTNVNSLLDAASGRVHGLRIAPLEKLASRLRQSEPDDGMLTATPDYLEGLAGSLKSDQESLNQLLATLNENIRHIHDVIRAQNRYADRSVKVVAEDLKTLTNEAISCCRARLEQDAVSVEVSIPQGVAVESDRSLVLQTMINIIGNARLSMRENSRPRRLEITAEATDQLVRIHFRDTGCGMSPEVQQRVFDAHFTTRESGSGLGLHFCAITLKRLGGSIDVSSDGPDRGSTFTIELPRSSSTNSEQSDVQAAECAAGDNDEK